MSWKLPKLKPKKRERLLSQREAALINSCVNMCFSMMWQSSSLSWWGERNISSPLCPDVPTIRSHFKTGTSSMADLIAAEIEKKGAIMWYYPSVIARASSQWRERENATFYSSSPSQNAISIQPSTHPPFHPSIPAEAGRNTPWTGQQSITEHRP